MKREPEQERQILNTFLLFQISQYYGHWAEDHPDVSEGRCVKSVVTDDESEGDNSEQHWELTTCEALLPFMCRINACPVGTYHCSNGNCVNNDFVCDGQGLNSQSFCVLMIFDISKFDMIFMEDSTRLPVQRFQNEKPH